VYTHVCLMRVDSFSLCTSMTTHAVSANQHNTTNSKTVFTTHVRVRTSCFIPVCQCFGGECRLPGSRGWECRVQEKYGTIKKWSIYSFC
jgi:hypothetical protein